MKRNDFDLVETKLFQDYKNDKYTLSDSEKMYSDLHRSYIFRYKSHSVIGSIDSIWTPFEFDNSVLELDSKTELFTTKPPCNGEYYLNILTGKELLNYQEIFKKGDLQYISNFYNTCIGILEKKGNVCLVEYTRPEIFLENINTILLYKTNGHFDFYFVSNNCRETRRKIFKFEPVSFLLDILEEIKLARLETNATVVSLLPKQPTAHVPLEPNVIVKSEIVVEKVQEPITEKVQEYVKEKVQDTRKLLESRPMSGKNCWTISELKKLVKVPSKYSKKQDIYDYIYNL